MLEIYELPKDILFIQTPIFVCPNLCVCLTIIVCKQSQVKTIVIYQLVMLQWVLADVSLYLL